MTIKWLPVRHHEGFYEVSSDGHVRRAKPASRTRVGYILKPAPDKDGYGRVVLHHDRKRHCIAVHRIVADAFLGPIPEGMQVNHRNGVKADNRIENLEIVTPSQNTAHGFRALGRAAPNNPSPGSKNGRAKLTEADVPAIRAMLSEGKGITEIGLHFGVSPAAIWMIQTGRTWLHV